jgi:hypothetical protein
VGIWRPAKGCAPGRCALDHWDTEQLGQHIGFISQTVRVVDGTISENIARMSVKPDADAVLRASRPPARIAILRLPNGYDTAIGEEARSRADSDSARFGARALWRPLSRCARRAEFQSTTKARALRRAIDQPQGARRHRRADRASAAVLPFATTCWCLPTGNGRSSGRAMSAAKITPVAAGRGRQSQGGERYHGTGQK